MTIDFLFRDSFAFWMSSRDMYFFIFLIISNQQKSGKNGVKSFIIL